MSNSKALLMCASTLILIDYDPKNLKVQYFDIGWMCALMTVMLTCYCASLAAVILLYYFYIGEHTGQCKLHEFFISFNMLICIALSIVSILPQVQGNKLELKEYNCYVADITISL